MKLTLLTTLILLSTPSMTIADEREMISKLSREPASVSAKRELNELQEKRKKELNAKIEKIILSEVKFKN